MQNLLSAMEPRYTRGSARVFIAYSEAQGRKFEPTGRLEPAEAEKCLDAAVAAFRERDRA